MGPTAGRPRDELPRACESSWPSSPLTCCMVLRPAPALGSDAEIICSDAELFEFLLLKGEVFLFRSDYCDMD